MAELPGVVGELAELLGVDKALALVEAYGGVQLYVPQTMTADHRLVKMIGPEAAGKLSDRYGGELIRSIPRCAAYVRSARDQEIRTRYTGGESAMALARAYAVTERQIWRIVSADSGPDPRQGRLL